MSDTRIRRYNRTIASARKSTFSNLYLVEYEDGGFRKWIYMNEEEARRFLRRYVRHKNLKSRYWYEGEMSRKNRRTPTLRDY